HPAAQPAEGRAVLAAPPQLPRRADAANAGVQPQRHQQLRVGRVPPRHPFAGLDGLAEACPVQLLHHGHHPAHRVGRPHQIVRALHHHGHLPAFRRPQPYPRPGFCRRLSHCCVCIAHAFPYNLHPREKRTKKSQALRMRTTTFGFASAISGFIFSPMLPALAKKTRPSRRRSNKPGNVSSSGCSSERGRNTLVPGFRPSRYTGGSATWYASATRDTTMATTIPFNVPSATTPAKAVRAHMNSVLRTPRIAVNSAGLINPIE